MTFWRRICPVCGAELPERGNRKLRVPGRVGWSLVHAGACAELVESQLVLELELGLAPRMPRGLEVVELVRMRRHAEQGREAVQLADDALERLVAIARSVVRAKREPLVSEVGEQRLQGRGEHLLELARALVIHGREASSSDRTELLA